jgi:acetylornithine deacetylase
MMDVREKRIITAVDALADDIIDLTERLVGQPSVLEREAGALQVMEEALRDLGLPPVRVPIEPEKLADHPGFAPVPWRYEGRYNLVAKRPADAAGGRSALFNGHLDVVSPEPLALWDTDPFNPVRREGWLYGRGAGDMKAGVAAMTYALHAVERAGFGLRAPVIVEVVIEEECCGNGALACLQAGYDAEAVLIPEPFGATLYTAQLGVLWFKVTMRGVPSHVLAAGSGTNAIEKSWPVIAALRSLEAAMNAEPRPAVYRDIRHPLNLNIGIFRGGDWPSTVPAAAEFHGRLAFFPGTSYLQVCRRIEAAVAQAAQADAWLADNPPQVEFYAFRSEGHTIGRDHPVLATLNACHRDLTGRDAESYVSTCTTDLRAFHQFGQGRGTCYGPVAENIHAANERVNLASIQQVAKSYALFLARWCGLAE